MNIWFGLTCLIVFLYGSIPAYAVVCDPNNKGCNLDHHIGVYYMNQYEQDWKDSTTLGIPTEETDPRNPFYAFYYAMKNGCYLLGNPAHNAKCAHIYSLRRQSAKELYQGIYRSHSEGWPWNQSIDYVKPKNMIKNATSDEDPDKGWGKYDMVFFYGHNAHLKPTYTNSSFGYWTYSNGTWTPQTGNWQYWGTTLMPYWYHAYSPITNAEPYPYMIFYTTDRFTSLLVGKDFNPNGFFYEDTWDQEIASYASLSLGSPDTKWIIAHGCAALPVATCSDWNCSTGVTPIANGKTAWSRYWHRIHIVLGHNSGIYPTSEPALVGTNMFSDKLLGGEKLQKAYFDIHTSIGPHANGGWPTALSAEDDTSRIWVINPITGKWGWAYAPSLTMMENDTWLSPRSAIINPTWWQTRWKSNISYSWNYYSMSSQIQSMDNLSALG